MKTGKLIAKILVAAAAVAGIVFVVATYGEQIVAWCKKLMESCACKCKKECACECEVVEEAPVEEVPAEEPVAEEVPAEEVAEDADFAN